MNEATYKAVKQYLTNLKWDGKSRINNIATKVLGMRSTRAFHELLSDAVRRVLEPGCKVDMHIVLLGAAGIGKTGFLEKLFGPWYGELDMTAPPTAWGIEFDPLQQPTESLKAYLTSTQDVSRAGTVPRSCVFVGANNASCVLDVSLLGSRRFWAVRCGRKIDLEALDRDQVWAEAVAMATTGVELASFYDTVEVPLLRDCSYRGDLFRDLSYKTEEHTNFRCSRRLSSYQVNGFVLRSIRAEVKCALGQEATEQVWLAAKVRLSLNDRRMIDVPLHELRGGMRIDPPEGLADNDDIAGEITIAVNDSHELPVLDSLDWRPSGWPEKPDAAVCLVKVVLEGVGRKPS